MIPERAQQLNQAGAAAVPPPAMAVPPPPPAPNGQPRDRGICGAYAPTLADGPTPICTLMAEHPGWHGDREGMSWVERNDAGPLAAAYERGIFDAGVAEGRRQATEGNAETVTIKASQYLDLLLADASMTALKAAGVENWDGWNEADWDGVDAHVAEAAADLAAHKAGGGRG